MLLRRGCAVFFFFVVCCQSIFLLLNSILLRGHQLSRRHDNHRVLGWSQDLRWLLLLRLLFGLIILHHALLDSLGLSRKIAVRELQAHLDVGHLLRHLVMIFRFKLVLADWWHNNRLIGRWLDHSRRCNHRGLNLVLLIARSLELVLLLSWLILGRSWLILL